MQLGEDEYSFTSNQWSRWCLEQILKVTNGYNFRRCNYSAMIQWDFMHLPYTRKSPGSRFCISRLYGSRSLEADDFLKPSPRLHFSRSTDVPRNFNWNSVVLRFDEPKTLCTTSHNYKIEWVNSCAMCIRYSLSPWLTTAKLRLMQPKRMAAPLFEI